MAGHAAATDQLSELATDTERSDPAEVNETKGESGDTGETEAKEGADGEAAADVNRTRRPRHPIGPHQAAAAPGRGPSHFADPKVRTTVQFSGPLSVVDASSPIMRKLVVREGVSDAARHAGCTTLAVNVSN